MSTLAVLSTVFRAETGQFMRGVDKVKAALHNANTRFQKSTPSIAKFGAAMAVAAGTGVALFARRSFQALDALNDTAEALNANAEALAGYQYAASFANVETESFNQSLSIMNKNLGDAADAGSPIAKTLAKIGLNFKDIKGLKSTEQFRKIADALSKVKDENEKAAIASDIFGKSGVKLLPIINQGAAGLDKYASEASAFGLAVNQVDLAKIDKADKSFTRLGAVITGMGNKVAVALSEPLARFSDQLTKLSTDGVGSIGLVATALAAVNVIAVAVLTVFKLWNIIVLTLATVFTAVGVVIAVVVSEVVDLVTMGMVDMSDGITNMMDVTKMTASALGDEVMSIGDLFSSPEEGVTSPTMNATAATMAPAAREDTKIMQEQTDILRQIAMNTKDSKAVLR